MKRIIAALKMPRRVHDFLHQARFIADFGLSQREQGEKSSARDVVTWPFRAPEIVCGEQLYRESSDMWSLGVLLLLHFFHYHLVDGQAQDSEATIQPSP